MRTNSPIRPALGALARLWIIASTLAVWTGCLEGFESLRTRVRYDPFEQAFFVQRTLIGVAPSFLGCDDIDTCMAVIERGLAVAPTSGGPLADRLLQRIVESGARDVRVQLLANGDRLDVILTYTAPLGSAAADDTMVRAEWDGKNEHGQYYLVVAAQDSMERPPKARTRKVARGGAGGVDWVQEWVLPTRQLEVTTEMVVSPPEPLFATVPGLSDALAQRGWLGAPGALRVAAQQAGPPVPEPSSEPSPAPVQAVSDPGPAQAPSPPMPAPAAPVPPPAPPAPMAATAPTAAPAPAAPRAPTAAPAPTGPTGVQAPPAVAPGPVTAEGRAPGPIAPEPAPAPVAPAPRAALWVPPDPTSPAKVWVYDVQVTGGGLATSAAAQASASLEPRLARCYQDRFADAPEVSGSVFLAASVRADGYVTSTSVYGQLTDRPLLACVERALADWSFPAWGSGDAISDVALPVVFRVEAAPPARGRKR